VSLEFRQEL